MHGRRNGPAFSLAFLMAAALGGCVTAQPVLRLTPQGGDPVWVGGTAVVSKTGETVRVAAAFARDYDGRIGFRVEVENRSAQPIVIDSNVFSFSTCKRTDPSQPEACAPDQVAINPEKVLLDMDIARSREQAQNTNDATFHSVLFLLDATASIATLPSGKPRDGAQAAVLAGQEGQMVDAAEARESRQVSAYELERANWTTEAFRKTTIFPGKAAAGLVFTERDVHAHTVWLLIRTEKEVFRFPFDQVVYVPRPDGLVEQR
jgi:hypothetical protein